MALTGRAALAALAGALLLLAFRSVPALIIVNALLVAAVAADLVLAAGVRQLRMSRHGDARIVLGSTGSVALTIENPGHRPLRAVVRDAWRPSTGAAPARSKVMVAPRGRVTVTTTLSPQRRGDAMPDRVTVRSVGPLGLAARQGYHQVPWVLRVLPPFLSRKHLPEKLGLLRQLDGQHRALTRGEGSEFDSLREYVLGDDVRSIDWRSTARQAQVMVRTWRPERDRRIILVLDTGRTAAGRVGGMPRLDAFLDAALLLAALAIRAGDRVDLLAVDRRVRARVVGAGRSATLAALTDAMAPVDAELVESDAHLLAGTILAMARQRCLVVLLTDLNKAAIEEGLLPHLPMLAARYRLLVAAVADPRLAEMAAGRGSTAAVYEAAAAEHARSERARVSALLRRLGVEVVDAEPDALAPALADAYLSLKGAGRL
ncbi:MAG TPA: DUF58 domain-containing protein [Streptosporangiaceae bacterium]|nr:DUF58 domain-containing protein [Streptosporangiaceae bacterium]